MPSESESRHFANPTGTLMRPNPHDELLASLERINTYNPPVQTCSTGWTFHGFYTGPTSIAYLFYRLSLLYPEAEFKYQSHREWAQAYLDLGARAPKPTPAPAHCGIGNETLAHLALTAVLGEDAGAAKQLCGYAGVINDGAEDGSNEWLYGRAGYLYFLRLCRSVLDGATHATTATLLDWTMEKTVDRMLAVPQPWTWHGKEYVGAAHGTVGIVCQIVLAVPRVAPQLQAVVSAVLDRQLESGNFPSSERRGSDGLVQFCHGGPGIVLSLRSLRPHYPELASRLATAVGRAQTDVWERGLLTKTPCLCHGIAGNALALDDEARFLHFLSFQSTAAMDKAGWLREVGRGDDVASLFTGEAGRAWAWAVADRGLPKTCIGYNDV